MKVKIDIEQVPGRPEIVTGPHPMTQRFEAIALLMREVLCEQVYREREKWTADHPCRALGLRTIEPREIVRYADVKILNCDSKALKETAALVLDCIVEARRHMAEREK